MLKLPQKLPPTQSSTYVVPTEAHTGARRAPARPAQVKDAQRLLNIYKSGIAEACGSSLRAQLLAYKGQMKGWQQKNNRDKLVLEVEPMDISGKPAPLPQQIRNEPPIAVSFPAISLAKVDLPLPLDPSRPMRSSSAITRLSRFRMALSP